MPGEPSSTAAAPATVAGETETPNPPASPAPSETAAATDTPASVPTATVTQDPASATRAAEMGAMGVLMNSNIQMYANPVGTPLKEWHNIPILAQATAGQEYTANIYSYRAAVDLAGALQFYKSKAQALGFIMAPGSGHGGTGSAAYHSADFLSFKVTIIITSYDNDPKNVLVLLASTS